MKCIKRIIFSFIVLAVIMSASIAGAEKIVLKSGIINDYKYSGNNISDYGAECVNDILNFSGTQNIEFCDTNIRDGLAKLRDGSVDFVCMLPYIDELLPYVDYSSYPMAGGFVALYTNEDKKLYSGDFSSFNGMKIGMLNRTVFEPVLKSYSSKNNFTYTPVYYDSIDAITAAISTNEIDAIFTPATDKPDGMRLLAKCGNVEYYFAVLKGNTSVLNKINSSLETFKEAYPFYISDNFLSFFKTPYNNMVDYTEGEYSALKTKETLRVFTTEDNYPLSYYNNETQKYDGMYVKILNKIAENSGFKIEFIPYDQSEMSMNGIVMGKADAILNVSGSRQGLIEASAPYTYMSYMPIALKDRNIFEDNELTIGILASDSWITDYIEQAHPNWSVQKYSKIHELLRSTEKQGIDMALISAPDIQTHTSLTAHPKLSIIPDFTVEVPVCLGISNITCNSRIVSLINKTIASLSVPESEFDVRFYTLSNTYMPNFLDILYANKRWIILIATALLLVFVFIILLERHYKKLSLMDTLTSIPNRAHFNTAAAKMLTKDLLSPHLLVSIDVHNFKLINDRFGQLVGNQTLIDLAAQIKEVFKDIGIYARSQGDHFLALAKDTEENRQKINTLTDINIIIHNTTNYHVPVKIGVCPITKYDPDLTVAHYIDHANIAKEYSSNHNVNRLSYFTDKMNNELETRNSIESEMVRALERGDFIVYYQPKYSLATDKIIGAEALVRWRHKERGLISPGLFIPLFERNGFIVDLDFYVYEHVLQFIRFRLDNNQNVVPISMNVSRCHLGNTSFADRLEKLVDKYRVPKNCIEMEITESIFSQEDTSAISLINDLKKRGFTISMDDFGSGYSSLNLLRKVPIDTLKIDKEFIDNSDTKRSRIIIEEIINMASKINIHTICEGVETTQQRDFLKSAGCDMVQGFLYSKPLPSADFEKLINSSI